MTLENSCATTSRAAFGNLLKSLELDLRTRMCSGVNGKFSTAVEVGSISGAKMVGGSMFAAVIVALIVYV